MKETSIEQDLSPVFIHSKTNPLEEIIRQGARQLLQTALDAEVEQILELFKEQKDENGRQRVVRNGYRPQREIVSGAGRLEVRPPRLRDRAGQERFTSAILPPYLRRVPSVDALIPALYLRGVSTGDFYEALEAILGPRAAGLSATNIVRLKRVWEKEHEQWSQRSLKDKQYLYLWADGVHFNVRLEEERTCILVLMGALADGTKELVAVWDGYRESKLSWQEVLRDLKRRGLRSPKLSIGDGALGFWAALQEEFPGCRQQRCWVHKTANVLDKLPKSQQAKAKGMIHDIYLAATRSEALTAFQSFHTLYQAKYPKACACLHKDKAELFAFYDFPAEHWQHIRTTNPIESTFATVRHRTRRTKGCGSRAATLAMVFKLAHTAQRRWRKLNGSHQIGKVIRGVKFIDGIEESHHQKETITQSA